MQVRRGVEPLSFRAKRSGVEKSLRLPSPLGRGAGGEGCLVIPSGAQRSRGISRVRFGPPRPLGEGLGVRVPLTRHRGAAALLVLLGGAARDADRADDVRSADGDGAGTGGEPRAVQRLGGAFEGSAR